MDLISKGAAWLNTKLAAYASTLLMYRRGEASIDIAMTIGGPKSPLFSLLGSVPGTLDLIQQNPENAVRSFAFDAADLDFGEGPVMPETGDQVLETIGGVVCVFEVMPPTTGQLAWDWIGPFRQDGARFLVHTQLTGTE